MIKNLHIAYFTLYQNHLSAKALHFGWGGWVTDCKFAKAARLLDR